jgi:hypothetical protein
MAATLGPVIGAAVDAAVAILPTLPGAGMVVGVYTPAGGTGSPVHGIVRRDEVPQGGVQRQGARIRFLFSEVSVEPTDGATFVETVTAVTWTIRTALRQLASFLCEAWA